MSSALFVSNISFEATENDFNHFIRKQQGVVSVDFKVDENGKNRGFALVTFDSPENAALAAKSIAQQKFQERFLRTKFDQPQERSNTKQRDPISIENIKSTGALFVGGIPESVTVAELKKLFEQFGEVKECTISMGREPNRSRGHGFVTFKDPSVALNLYTGSKPVQLGNRTLSLQSRIPNERTSSSGSGENNSVHITCASSIDEKLIRSTFSDFGEIVGVKVLEKNSFGSIVVQFQSEESARLAVLRKNNSEIQGHSGKITVSLASDRSRRSAPSQGNSQSASKSSVETFSEPKQHTSTPTFTSTQASSQQSFEYPVSKRKPSKDELAIVQFFYGCVFADSHSNSSPAPWSDASRCSGITYEQLLSKLDKGSRAVGEVRAKLFYSWYILLQDSENLDTRRFQAPSGNLVSFQSIFLNSKAIENIVEVLFEDGLQSPVPNGTLPDSCKLGVRDLLVKIFSKTLIGSSQLHLDLLDGVQKLSTLPQVSSQLKRNIAQLFSCFKVDNSDSRSHAEQLKSVDAKIQELRSSGESSAEVIRLLQEKWSLVLKETGGGNMGDVGIVYQSLSSEVGSLTASVTSSLAQHKSEQDRLDAEIRKLKQATKSELSESESLESYPSKIQSLNSKKDHVTGEIGKLLQKLEYLEDQRKALLKQKDEVLSGVAPAIETLNKKKAALEKLIEVEEAKNSSFVHVLKSLEDCQRSIKKPKTKTNEFSELSALSLETLEIVAQHLSTIVDGTFKIKTRIDFCRSTLTQMESEHEEMKKFGFDDVAKDLSLGMAKLNKEINDLMGQLKPQIREAERVCSWVSRLQASGLMREDVSKVLQLQKTIASTAN